jgi:glycosyltransferase involved in cell wall biosynthesis
MSLVSVITVSKNNARFIEDNILGVKHQSYPKVEHIVIDGGSTDSTVDILKKYKDVRWVSEPDSGVTDAFNKGISMASGDMVAFLNSDDVYHSRDSVSKAVAAMVNRPDAGVVFGDCSFINAEGNVTGFSNENEQQFNFPALLCSEYVIPMASAFIRRSAIEAIGGKLDTSLDFAPDWELWIRIGLRFPILYIPETLGSVRAYSGATQATLRCATENPAKRRLILEWVFSNPELPAEIRSLQKRAYAGTYFTEAFILLNIDRREMARKCIRTAFWLYPRHLLNLLLLSYLLRSLGCGKPVDWASALKRKVLKRQPKLDGNQTIRWWLR